MELIVFSVLAVLAVASAVAVIASRNPVSSALFLVLNFFTLAGLYLTLHAQFLAVVQVLVYAGAIMVLVLFVIMLLNLGDETRLREKLSVRRVLGFAVGGAFLVELLVIFFGGATGGPTEMSPRALEIGTVQYVGTQMFSKFLFPFEVTSLLLLAAVVGAVVLAKRDFK